VRVLLDTHTLLWAIDDPAKLGPVATATFHDRANVLLLSAASVWELAIKVGLGKLTLSRPFRNWMDQSLADLGVTLLPITVEYADALAALPDTTVTRSTASSSPRPSSKKW